MAQRERFRSEARSRSYLVSHPHALPSPRPSEIRPCLPQRRGRGAGAIGRRARWSESRSCTCSRGACRARTGPAQGSRARVFRRVVVHRDRDASLRSRRNGEVADRRRSRSPPKWHGETSREREEVMTPDIRELLPLYALGILAPDEERAVEAAIARDSALADELAAFRDAASEMIEISVPVTPSPDVEKRLMASIGGGRFERFAAQLGKVYDVTVERMREILGLAERPASWEAAMP